MTICEHCGEVLIEVRQGSVTRERCSVCTLRRVTFQIPEPRPMIHFVPLSVAIVPLRESPPRRRVNVVHW